MTQGISLLLIILGDEGTLINFSGVVATIVAICWVEPMASFGINALMIF
jgi:hypothetical protein